MGPEIAVLGWEARGWGVHPQDTTGGPAVPQGHRAGALPPLLLTVVGSPGHPPACSLQPGARESPASSTPGHRNPCDQRLQPAQDSVVWRDSSAPCRQLAESLHITATTS